MERGSKAILLKQQNRYEVYLMTLLSLLFFSCFLSAAPAHAQANSERSTILIQNDHDIYDIGPVLRYVPNESGIFNIQAYNRIINDYLAGRAGTGINGNILKMGIGDTPYWIIFEVLNDSFQDNWVLSFGSPSNGRFGYIEDVFFYEHLSKTRYLDTLTQDSNDMIKQRMPVGGAIPFTLEQGKTGIFVAYIVPKAGAVTAINPSIQSPAQYFKKSLVTTPVFWAFVLLLCAGAFVGVAGAFQFIPALGFAGYYVLLALIPLYQNSIFMGDFPLAEKVPGILYNAAIMIGLLMTRYFLHSAIQKTQIMIMAAGFGFMLFTSLVATFILSSSFILQPFFMYFPLFVGVGVVLLLSAIQKFNGIRGATVYAASWAIFGFGLLITVMTSLGLLPANGITIHMVFLGALVQAGGVLGSYIYRHVKMTDEKIVQAYEKKEDLSVAEKLAMTRQVSENKRLVRLMEHERVLMAEMQAREAQQKEEMRLSKEEADLANNAKSAFLAVVSHEIRTPMTGIMGMVRLLLDTAMDKKQKEYSQTIQDSGNAMMSLLNDILDFEKIESGKMDMEYIDFDLFRLINGIQTLMSGHAEAKNIKLDVNIADNVPRYAIGDSVRLRQVILNLIGNSIKFTDLGGVAIIVESLPFEDEDAAQNHGKHRIRISIKDTGIGISPEAQKRLFNPFSQADNSIARKYGGTGLGLTISARLIEAMGGKIEIDSVINEGSTFFFTVALAEGSAEAIDSMDSQDRAMRSKTAEKALSIMIVEDNEITQRLMRELVERMGHSVQVAGSGEDAILLLKDHDFDVALMDIGLPGMSGMGTTKAIRALDDMAKSSLPVIALTGNVQDEDIRKCYAANMNGHLAKPIDPKKLVQQLQKVTDNELDNPVVVSADEASSKTNTRQVSAPPETPKTETPKTENPKTKTEQDTAESEALADEYENSSPIQTFVGKQGDAGASENSLESLSLDDIEDDSFESSIKQIEERDEKSDNGILDERFAIESDLSLDDGNDEKTPSKDSIKDSEDDGVIINSSMLDSLKNSVGDEIMSSLLEGFLEKADEIILKIESLKGTGDSAELKARAHELKGMAGNFGVMEVSKLAETIEELSKKDKFDEAIIFADSLAKAQAKARDALKDWL